VIAGICQVKNEIDIVELVIRHTLAEGVDHLWVSDHISTDGTWDLLQEYAKEYPITLLRDECPVFDQPGRMNTLAAMAREAGADWIVPFDADEFFYAPNGGSIALNLRSLPAEVSKLYCRALRYLDFKRRDIHEQRAKVVFRALPEAWLIAGNHDVSLPGGLWNVLEVAHLQYRDPAQFIRKVRGLEAYEPLFSVQGRPPWLDLDHEDLMNEWRALCAVETVEEPIPLRVPVEAR
jgi:glycosyltransferase involved in cell wall biosynthesis